MQRPLFHILLAFIVGVWSPLCCCQAALLVSDLTGMPSRCGTSGIADAIDSRPAAHCCGGCCGERDQQPMPSNDSDTRHEQSPCESTPCHDCPACQGTVGIPNGTVDSSSALKSIAYQFAIPAPTTLSTWSVAPHPFPAVVGKPVDHSGRGDGGRAILRLHCALLV